MSRPKSRHPATLGFSLVEILAVMAIIVIMLSLLTPIVSSFTSTAGRKGAINILMNTFEAARSAALESGANVYVLLWQRQYPENDCLIVVRDPVEWKKEEQTALDKGERIALTRYIPMPKGVLLYGAKGANVFSPPSDSSELKALVQQMPEVGGTKPDISEIGYIKFGPTGSILFPDKNHCKVVVSEGVRDANHTEALIASRKNSRGGFEIITFRRFVGRAAVDVSTIE